MPQQTSPVFNFNEFHIPYYALREGSEILDHRKFRGERLRSAQRLPLQWVSKDKAELYYYEAQISSLSLGPDDWFWTEYFLVDTYFGSEERLHVYFEDCRPGEEFDPPLAGGGTMLCPCYEPREYFLLKLCRRILQITREYTVLVDTFHERMNDYIKIVSTIYEDDNDKTHTRTLGAVMSTIQLFSGCLDGTIKAWDAFYSTHQQFFTTFGKEDWHGRIDTIMQNMTELKELQLLLSNKREWFDCKLKNLSTVSALVEAAEARRQTANVIKQGEYTKRLTEVTVTLTEMTVYVAFPVLLSTSVFSMDFFKPAAPGITFGIFWVIGMILTFVTARYIGRVLAWINCKVFGDI